MKDSMTYEGVLDFLFGQLPMYQRAGKVAYKKDLSNTTKLCAALGNPQNRFPAIHIAGTNGKGSTAHMIAGILQAAGYKVGLYTSPHYRDYRERIKINGKYISRQKVIDFVQSAKSDIEAIKPSFFEMTVALAFKHFADQKVDIAVIETGLGGRLDSTNIISPLVSVITNIGLDHQSLLGDTIPLIAAEKAGIIKEETPCVIGKYQTETEGVFEKAGTLKNAEIIYAKDLMNLEVIDHAFSSTSIRTEVSGEAPYLISLPSGSRYNIENCRTAISAVQILDQRSDFKISQSSIQAGLQDFPEQTKYLGRWHIKSSHPSVLLDAAHNEDGVKALFDDLAKYTFDKVHIILGMVDDKDSSKILKLLPRAAKYYFCRPDIPRGKDRRTLQLEASKYDLKGRSYVSCKSALKAAKRSANLKDLILATGSSFVVAELV